MAKGLESLPSRCKTLSRNLSIAKKKRMKNLDTLKMAGAGERLSPSAVYSAVCRPSVSLTVFRRRMSCTGETDAVCKLVGDYH
jgi:hypothetical protein